MRTLDKRLYEWGLLSAEGLVLPDFLGIGAQKAGTTWLYENLRQHPRICFPAEKEVHYFNRNFHRPLKEYSALFAESGEGVQGEITPGYGILPQSRIRFIRSVMPDVRLILLLRNPIQRAWSHAVKNLATLRHRRISEVPAREFEMHFQAERSRRRGDYLEILDSWLSIFPEESLFIGFHDDIAENPQRLLQAIFRHLRVTTNVDWNRFPCEDIIIPIYEHGIVKEGIPVGQDRSSAKSIPLPLLKILEDMYCEELEILHQRLGGATNSWLCR